MSFEFIVEKEEKPRKLSEDGAGKIAADVAALWSAWDTAREKQKHIADKLRPEIYLDERESSDRGEDDWKSDVHLNKIYSLSQTQQAFIWDNVYSSIDKLFDVEGNDPQSDEHAKEQKANLVNIFYSVGLQRKLDQAIEYLQSVGEMCLFIGWKTQYRQIRRKMTFAENFAQNGMEALFSGDKFGVFSELVYDGANVDAINPIDLTFDPKVSPEEQDKFDACGKIIKSWETYDAIATNKVYRLLSKEQLRELKNMLNQKPDEQDEAATAKTDDVVQQNRVEVLQYWGNYTMEDGTVLRNWNIVVIARKYLAVFEANRWIINPIINMAVFRDVKSKRGIPEIWSVYDIAREQEKKVNLENDAQALNLNPPAYAPEGFFDNKKTVLCPGKQIEYKLNMEDPNSIIKMQFPLLSNETIIEYLDNTASMVSGIFPNMQGQEESGDRTATEIKVKVQGQTTRLSKTLDSIKQNAIVPMVTKVAELDANMKFGDEQIYVENPATGEREAQTVGDVVRQGNYSYKYTDNTGIQRKLARNQELVQILAQVWNDPEVALNKREIIKDVLETAEYENVDKYFLNTAQPPQIPAVNGAAPQLQTPQMPDVPQEENI